MNPAPRAEQPETPSEAGSHSPEPSWFQRLTAVVFIIFCFELGLFLLIYPWTDGWGDNYFAWAFPGAIQTSWHTFWNNSFVRGAISGLGLVNVWIAVVEALQMFARRRRSRI